MKKETTMKELLSPKGDFKLTLSKHPEYNTVEFQVLTVEGYDGENNAFWKPTTFHGHFGYDLCIHLRTSADGEDNYDDLDHYHHFCSGEQLADLGQMLAEAQKQLKTPEYIPGFKPVI
jgi:hypothetical protein